MGDFPLSNLPFTLAQCPWAAKKQKLKKCGICHICPTPSEACGWWKTADFGTNPGKTLDTISLVTTLPARWTFMSS